MLQLHDRPQGPLADSISLSDPPGIYKVVGQFLKWRAGLGHPVDLHPSARKRIEGRRDYRPRSLKNLMPELFGGAPVIPAPPPARPTNRSR